MFNSSISIPPIKNASWWRKREEAAVLQREHLLAADYNLLLSLYVYIKVRGEKLHINNYFDDGSLPLITPVKREDEKEEIFFSPVKNSLLVMGVGFRFHFAFYSLKKIRPGTEPGEPRRPGQWFRI